MYISKCDIYVLRIHTHCLHVARLFGGKGKKIQKKKKCIYMCVENVYIRMRTAYAR